MATLKSRQSQIPNGFRYVIPELKWSAPPYSSFDSIVNAVQATFNANPHLCAKHGWPTDRAEVANLVEQYNVKLCQDMGWTKYIHDVTQPDGGGTRPPFPNPSLLQSGVRVAVGARTLIDWLGDGGKPVPHAQAEARSNICVTCPLNTPGDLTNWFTRGASELIRKQVGAARDLGMSTSSDDKLGVCSACSCPVALKVHVPLAYILKSIPADSKKALDSKCWIRVEEYVKP